MKLETQEIQGIILSGYAHLPYSSFWMFHAGDRAEGRRWLAELFDKVTWGDWKKDADGKAEKPESALNVAFTRAGLELLDLPCETVKEFSQEFREGMADSNRARKLGDVDDNGPGVWEICKRDGKVPHVMLILQAGSAGNLEALEKCHREILTKYPAIEEADTPQHGFTSADSKEPFGFRDSITQPQIEGSPKKPEPGQLLIKPGEFILGYENEYLHLPPSPRIPANATRKADEPQFDFGRNGSYLVFRKLEQDVAAFHQYSRDHAKGRDPMYVASKMVGRWPSGLPLVQYPDADDPERAEVAAATGNLNSFNYARTDPAGLRCPIGSHIRRMNPRDAMENRLPDASDHDVRRHQILRRGTAYPPPDANDREPKRQGLLFVCINADIRRQFEFLQQTWGNNPFFRGLQNDPDPLTGTRSAAVEERSGCPVAFTIQAPRVRERLTKFPKFVTLRGGEYFFLPSRSALQYLCGSRSVGT